MGFTNPYPASRLSVNSTNSLVTGMQAWFPLTEGTGTSAQCILHAYHTGTITNGAWVSESIGTALDLGTTSNVGSTNVNVSTAVTMSLWYKEDGATASGPMFLSLPRSTGGANGMDLQHRGNGVRLGLHTSSGSRVTATSSAVNIGDGEWHHIAGTYDGSNIRLYVDGLERASAAQTGTVSQLANGEFNINALSSGTSGFSCDGIYQNVGVWDRALSATEVATLYHRPWEGTNYGDLWPYSPPAPADATLSTDTAATSLMTDCVLWYPLTEGSGTVATDLVGSNNGTLAAGAAWNDKETLGTVLELDGTSNAYATTPAITANSQPITHSIWFRYDGGSSTVYIFDGLSASSRQIIWFSSGTILSVYAGASTSGVGNAGQFTDGEWHNLVAVFNSSSTTVYVDGVLETSGYVGNADWAGSTIGARYSLSGPFPGDLQNYRVWERALTADEARLLYERPWEGIEYGDAFHYDPPTPSSLTPLTSDPINTNQVGWWPLTETDDYASGAADISGSANNGTQSGGVLSEVSSLGGVASFDGVDDHILIGSVDDTTYSMSSFTASLWFELDPTYTPSRYDFIAGFCNSSGYGWRFWTQDGTSRLLSFSLRDSTTNTHVETTQTLSELGLFHATGTWDGTNHRLYVNGVEVASTTRGVDPGGSNKYFLMGAMVQSFPATYREIKGKLSNVRTWNRALTADEVWSIYANPWLGSAYQATAAEVLYNYIFRSQRFRRLA